MSKKIMIIISIIVIFLMICIATFFLLIYDKEKKELYGMMFIEKQLKQADLVNNQFRYI